MNPAVDISPNLELAADYYNRYPGELVTLFLRFVAPVQPGVTLQLAMPRVMQAETYLLPPEIPSTLPSVSEIGQDVVVLIPLAEHFSGGKAYELGVGVRLKTFHANQRLEVEARLVTDQAALLDLAALSITIFGTGKYLQSLPEIYADDNFTSRFLMLFESFWKPINQQIDQIDSYFDPNLTPPTFVPWLASWLGMPVDPALPLDRVRVLLKSALMLYQCRGTPLALKTYLEIYTAGQVTLLERRAINFVLGQAAALGMDVALGKTNQPNSLGIHLAVSEAELDRTRYSAETYRQKISELVRTLVPAHIRYDISCEFTAKQP